MYFVERSGRRVIEFRSRRVISAAKTMCTVRGDVAIKYFRGAATSAGGKTRRVSNATTTPAARVQRDPDVY